VAPAGPGETIDLSKLLGASCTLVISHRQNAVGRTYGTIDAVSKPTKKAVPSGQYDPAETRRRIAEWKARDAGGLPAGNPKAEVRNPNGPQGTQATEGAQAAPKSVAPRPSRTAQEGAAAGASRRGQDDFDPEVGF